MTTIDTHALSASAARAVPFPAVRTRVREIDVLRGLVMVLMVLDHARDYLHVDAFAYNPLDPARTTPALYATRWITHLCAPTFVFLAGVSASLQLARGKSTGELSWLLLTRGAWLVLLEATILSFGWSFSFPYPLFLQVIWAIGWSMVALAGLVWLPRNAVLGIGIAIVAGHNLLDPITLDRFGGGAWLWTLLHEGGILRVAGSPVGFAAYPVLPWIGVMAVGYGLGRLFLAPPETRDPRLTFLGIAMLATFLALRAANLYGDPHPWTVQADPIATAMAFLDVAKYPPSLMYVLATLGIVLALWQPISFLPRPALKVLGVFGAVPFFFYVLHVYLVHVLAIVANAAAGHDPSALFGYLVNTRDPERIGGLGFSLRWVYLATGVVLALLYPLCRSFGEVKRTRREWWLSYL